MPQPLHSLVRHAPRPVALAVHLAWAGMLLAAPAWTPAAQAQEARVAYRIAPGPLAGALNGFAAASGIFLSGTAELAQGKTSPGLQGSFTVAEGLARLLQGTGLEAAERSANTYVLRPLPVAGSAATPQGDAPSLPAVRVTAEAERETATGPVAGFAARRSATGTKTDASLLETPQSVSVVTRDEMDARGMQSVMEAIRYVPSVSVENWGVDVRGREWFLMRGFDATDTSSDLDGLNQARSGFIALRKDSYGLERVDVLRGPSSVLFGQGDAGGVVNRVSKRPAADAQREIEVQAGNYGRKQVAADWSGALDERGELLYRIVGLGLDTGTQQRYGNGDRVKVEHSFIAPSLLWKPSADTSLLVLADVLRDENGGSPGYVTRADGSNTGLLGGDPAFLRYRHHQASLGYELRHRFAPGWTLQQNFRTTDADVTNRRLNRGSVDDSGATYFRTPFFADQSLRQTVLDTQVQGELTAGAVRHSLLLGVDWNRYRGESRDAAGLDVPLSLAQPVYGLPIPVPTYLVEDFQERIQQVGFYAQDQIHFGEHWLLTLGGRHDRARADYLDRLAGGADGIRASAFTGRAGLTYLMPSGWAPYVSYAQSFLPQSGRDFSGNPFDPTRGRQVEAGIKYQPEGGKTLFTAAVFDLVKRNVKTADPLHIDEYQQTGAVRSRGLELEAKAELARGWNLIAAYAYNDVKITESNDGDQGKSPIQIPRQSASAWLDFAPAWAGWQGWGFGVGARHVGSRYDDAANTASSPAYTVLDLAVRYEQGPWRYAVNVSNATNRHYAVTRAYGGYYPGADRTVVASVKYRF